MNIARILTTLGHVPGVPAAGHMDGQFWHPGSRATCQKGSCGRKHDSRE